MSDSHGKYFLMCPYCCTEHYGEDVEITDVYQSKDEIIVEYFCSTTQRIGKACLQYKEGYSKSIR